MVCCTGDAEKAAHYFRQMLKLREMQEISGPETQEVRAHATCSGGSGDGCSSGSVCARGGGGGGWPALVRVAMAEGTGRELATLAEAGRAAHARRACEPIRTSTAAAATASPPHLAWQALLFLANYCKDTGSLQEAQQYCSRLLDFGGHEKEEAKALLRDIRSRMQFSGQPGN